MSGRRVLVAYATKMGSTAEIADAIADQLRSHELEVVVLPFSAAPDPSGFDAFVGGSAIYATRWQRSARRYLRDHRETLAARPCWLFESGPTGDLSERRHESPAGVIRLAGEIGSPQIKVFGGNLDAARATSAIAKWVANSDLAGDYRNWTDIRDWADGVARSLIGGVPDSVAGSEG
ncbi:flavodoxin domain-containing protein [Microlunatus ginsengisoli]|uniref:Flavodoxin domain-containing protein n=1 Tax=Microlunatus ginsengisoli TaxID=363863 RepID=A0ABP7AGW1_9ACTN